MALLNIESVLVKALRMLSRSPPGKGLEILSYKRNRGVSILRISDTRYRILERGYKQADLEITEKQLSRLLKTVIKREFPRSRKLRVYHLESPEELGRQRKRL